MNRILYNDYDPKCCAWISELVKAGEIPKGDIVCKSITEINPDELKPYIQFHAFCGIAGWPYALTLAGWPEDRPVWTGSCPCQPFSCAGKGLGQADERHLWPVFFGLIHECKPLVVFGEQVASAIGRGWLDGISADLESENYTCGAVVLGAHSVGAPHIRQRLYWVAESQGEGWSGMDSKCETGERERPRIGSCGADGNWQRVIFSADCDEDGNCPVCGIDFADCGCPGPTQDGYEYEERPDGYFARRLGESKSIGLEGQNIRDNGKSSNGITKASAWSDHRLIQCRDGKARRFEPGTFPLAHGVSGRVGLLRGYGNAIIAPLAAQFIQASVEAMNDLRRK